MTRKERKASREQIKKILREQLLLLSKYSLDVYEPHQAAALSNAMVAIVQELNRT